MHLVEGRRAGPPPATDGSSLATCLAVSDPFSLWGLSTRYPTPHSMTASSGPAKTLPSSSRATAISTRTFGTKFFFPLMEKLPRARYSPLGAAELTWSGVTQYASAAPRAVFHALLKATVACATCLTSSGVCPFPPFRTKKGEPNRSAW